MSLVNQDVGSRELSSQNDAIAIAISPALLSTSAWMTALGLSLAPAVTTGIARFSYGLILPAMREDLSWTYTEAGWINTANAIGYLMGSLLALMFVAKLGPRRLFVGGMIVTTLALLASALTRDFWFLSLWRVLAGLGGAPAFIAGGAMVSTLFRVDPSRNAMAIAVYGGGGGFGTLLTALLIPSMLANGGNDAWPIAWLLLAALSALATIPAVFAAHVIPLSIESRGGETPGAVSIGPMLPALIGYFLFSIGYIVYITFLISWMRSQGAGTAATWAVLGLAIMLSPVPWRRLLARVQGGQALALACLATGVGTLLPLVVPGPTGLLLSAATFGGSFFIAPTAITAFGRKNLPEASWGRSVALFTCVFAVGQTLGPVVAGGLADATESLAPGLVAAAVTLFLGATVAARQVALRN